MLPAVGDFLKGTFGESLKKPLQPAGVFAAGIFLLLHALFIFPTLVDQNQPMAIAIRDMGAGSQAVLAAVIVLVASYVLLSMGASTLKLMSGEIWRTSPGFGRRLVDWQASRRRALRRKLWSDKAETTERRADRRQSLFRASRDYPPANTLVTPTALGNVLQATNAYLWDRYRIDMTTIWPHMETIVADETALSARIDDEKATLDFLLNLALVLMVFAFEHAALRLSVRQWPEAVWSLGFVIAGWAIYSAAVSKARSWGSAVQLAFDLHRDKLRKSFGLRPFTSPADEREVWRRVSRWLLWGEPLDDQFIEGWTNANGPTLMYADNIKVQAVSGERIQDLTFAGGRDQSHVDWTKSLDYVLLVSSANSNASDSTPPMGVHVLVSDQRLPRHNPHRELALEPLQPPTQTGWLWQSAPSADPAAPPSFLWSTKGVPANGTSLLQYSLPVAKLDVSSDADWLTIGDASMVTACAGMLALDCTLDLRMRGGPTSQPGAHLVLVDSRISAPDTDLLLPGRLVAESAPIRQVSAREEPGATACERKYVFDFDRPKADARVTLRCLLLARAATDVSDRLKEILLNVAPWPEVSLSPPAVYGPEWRGLLCHPKPGDPEQIDWTKLGQGAGAPLSVWAWVLMALGDIPQTVPSAAVLNNLGCAWMWFAEWDQAERKFRDALTPQVRESEGLDATWREGDERPQSAKEAADQNLYQLSRARDAWMRGR